MDNLLGDIREGGAGKDFPEQFRWNSIDGCPGRTVFDPATGMRAVVPFELGSKEARFVVCAHTFERGFLRIGTNVFESRLTPVGSPPPEDPGADFKPAIGCYIWNLSFGELRLESNQATLIRPMNAFWAEYRGYKEASAGLLPVILFKDRIAVHFQKFGKSYWSPIVELINFVERERIPAFMSREPTVALPPARDSQISHKLLLEQRKTAPAVQAALAAKLAAQPKAAGAPVKKQEPPPRPKPPTTGDLIDDSLPDDPLDDIA